MGEGGMCVCVCVCVGVWVRRARGSLDGWCMFVWSVRGVNYADWNGCTCYVGEAFLIDSE